MIGLIIYLILCLLWSIYAFYKQRVSYSAPFNCWENCITTAIVNFLVCPIAICVAIKKKKF